MEIALKSKLKLILQLIKLAIEFIFNLLIDFLDQKKLNQEIKPLINIPDSFKKVIIVRDNIKLRRDENGIITMSLKEFLLNENIFEK